MQILMVLQYILKQFCMPQNSPLPAAFCSVTGRDCDVFTHELLTSQKCLRLQNNVHGGDVNCHSRPQSGARPSHVPPIFANSPKDQGAERSNLEREMWNVVSSGRQKLITTGQSIRRKLMDSEVIVLMVEYLNSCGASEYGLNLFKVAEWILSKLHPFVLPVASCWGHFVVAFAYWGRGIAKAWFNGTGPFET